MISSYNIFKVNNSWKILTFLSMDNKPCLPKPNKMLHIVSSVNLITFYNFGISLSN